jgi:hypothetical protein
MNLRFEIIVNQLLTAKIITVKKYGLKHCLSARMTAHGA